LSRKPLIGMYAGSFDPFTFGHLDVVERASKLLDQLVIAIGTHSSKNNLFSDQEKLEHLEFLKSRFPNVSFVPFSGLAVDFASSRGISVLIRGLRTEADFTYEMQMAVMNRVLNPEIQTIFIPSRQDLGHISSTLVKEIARLGGNVSALVPPHVATSLKSKFS
jgi:pantetheine-phosphate adenylyltransferase